MKNTHLVSVLMPVRNGERFIVDSIRSILCQNYKNFEFIVIDNASTDNSVPMVRAFHDNRIRLSANESNQGLVYSLNKAIGMAQGEFMARMDVDDVCHPRRFERQVHFLETHPDIGFCGTWVRRFGEHQAAQTYRRPVGAARVRAFAVFDNPMVHSSVMLRRDVFSRLDVGYRDEFANAEDYDLWTRLFEISLGENIPEVLLDYRVHAQSVTLQQSESMDRTACRVLKRELSRLGLEPTEDEVVRHRLWSTGRFNQDDVSQDIDCAEHWLVRLVEANRESRACDPAAFLWAAREIWFALCYRVLAEGRPILKRYFRSPISRGDHKNGMVLLGALAKRRL